MRITNAAGTDVSFENDPKRPVNNEIDYRIPGGHFLLGQIGWGPSEDSIHGVIAFDGSVSGGEGADFPHLSQPIKYTVEKGRIQKITGGPEAESLNNYFASLQDPNMYLAAHVCYGCNPNARLEGVTAEDERVWGSTEWGFGHQGPGYSGGEPRKAKSHIDGISLKCTVYLDGKPILENGVYTEPTLKKLAEKIGK
jgi:leucyl aminopeptidase (aminopeptidase T)